MAVAAPARAPQRAAPRPAPAEPRRSPRPVQTRPRVAGGVIWIALVAFLLAGVVALNVAALQLNLESQRLEERKEKLLGENAAAASELSGLAASARIEQVAREELGLVDPAQITYVRIRDGRR
ncbi:MAG: cell division protein FtsL [Actinobacteria bacterium]|nr:cell division protein FtsL [Actinomycetota bacterium]